MIRPFSLCVCAAALAACNPINDLTGSYAPAPAETAGTSGSYAAAAPGAAPGYTPAAAIPGVRYVDEAGADVGPPPATAPVTPAGGGVATYASEEAALAAASANIVRADVPPPAVPAAAPTRAPTREVVSSVETRRQIWIVGDAPMVEDAETILNINGFPDLKTDGNGSDAGAAAFCSGIGYQAPDMVAIARAFTEGEKATCERNSVSFNSIGAVGGFIAVKDSHMALVPNLSDAFDALNE